MQRNAAIHPELLQLLNYFNNGFSLGSVGLREPVRYATVACFFTPQRKSEIDPQKL
jgi:hypothetical protein